MNRIQHKIETRCDKFLIDLSTDKKVPVYFDKKSFQTRIRGIMNWVCETPTYLDVFFSGNIQTIMQLNTQYRSRPKPTDVLSFPPSHEERLSTTWDPSLAGFTPLGSLLICLPICLKQSKQFRIDFAQEVEKMVVHGLIHLKGFDHERDLNAHKIMTSLEKTIQKQIIKTWGPPQWLSLQL